MTMPRRAADFRLLPQAQEKTSVQPEGLHRRKKSSPDAKKRSRCRQVPRRRSGVSDLSAPACAGGLHSDPLAGLCTPFRLSAQRADGTVCRYLICGFFTDIKISYNSCLCKSNRRKIWGKMNGGSKAFPSEEGAVCRKSLLFTKQYETSTVRVGADAHIGPRKVANLP